MAERGRGVAIGPGTRAPRWVPDARAAPAGRDPLAGAGRAGLARGRLPALWRAGGGRSRARRGPPGRPGAPGLSVRPPAVGDTSAALRDPTSAPMREGRFRTRWFSGLRPLRISAPGVGFGMTGSLEVRADRTARSEPPPLARYGRIEGSVEPGLIGPETSAVVGQGAWDQRRGEVDAQGRFAIDDVIPGRRTVRLFRSGKPLPTATAVATVAPGETARVAVRGPAAGRGAGEAPEREPDGVSRHEGILVEGTVRDEAGQPLEGVRVFARAESYGFTFLHGEPTVSATTDATGRFRIEGRMHGLMGPLSVWAVARGRPASMAYAMVRAGPASGGHR